MQPFTAVDQWLIVRVFEPVAWRVEHATGVNQFALARYVLAVLFAVHVTLHLLVPPRHNEPASYSGMVLGLIILAAAVRRSRIAETWAIRLNHNDHETSGGKFERAIFWSFTIAFTVSSLSSAAWFTNDFDREQHRLLLIANAAYLAFLYFCACRMKPPEYGLDPVEAPSHI